MMRQQDNTLMFSWRLLRALITPPRPSPLVRRLLFLSAVDSYALPRPRGTMRRALQILILIVMPLAAIFFLFPVITLLYISTLSYAPILLALVNSTFGAILAASVAGAIAREHDLRTYDLLSTVPGGRFGLHFSYCRSWIMQHRTYFWFVLPFVVIGMFGLMLGLGLESVFRYPGVGDGITLGTLAQRGALIAAYGIDVVHSFVAAAVIGMWLPSDASARGTAWVSAIGAYGLVQMTAYLTLFAFGTVLMPMFGSMFGSTPIMQIGFSILMIASFFAVREASIVLIWREMGQHLNASADEIDPRGKWLSPSKNIAEYN